MQKKMVKLIELFVSADALKTEIKIHSTMKSNISVARISNIHIGIISKMQCAMRKKKESTKRKRELESFAKCFTKAI